MTVIDRFLANWRAIVLLLAGSVLLVAAAYIKGRSDGRAVVQLQLERANARYLEQRNRADALSADRRLTDAIAVNRQEQELRDAIASTPDSAPDAVRIALGCARLRANGRDTASLPTVCRTGGGTEASPSR